MAHAPEPTMHGGYLVVTVAPHHAQPEFPQGPVLSVVRPLIIVRKTGSKTASEQFSWKDLRKLDGQFPPRKLVQKTY